MKPTVSRRKETRAEHKYMDFPPGPVVTISPTNTGDASSISGLGKSHMQQGN